MNALWYRNWLVAIAMLQSASTPLRSSSLSQPLWLIICESVQWWDLGTLPHADVWKYLRSCPCRVNSSTNTRPRLWLSNVTEFREVTSILLLLDKVSVEVLRVLNARLNLFQGLQHHHVLLVYTLDFLFSDAMVQSDLRWIQFLSSCLLSLL